VTCSLRKETRLTTPNSQPSNSKSLAPWKLGVGILGVATAAVFAALPVVAAGRSVSFRASDGRTINALAFEPSQRPSPAVVLVPMLGRPKEDWDALGQRLADANIFALAIDLAGLSDPGDSKVLAGWSGDVRAAVAYLSSRPDVRPGAIGIAGASLGASLGAIAAAGDPSVRSLALISPALDYRGLRIEASMKQFGGRPALLIASTHDPYAARSVRELAKDAAGTRETRFSDITAHGTALLARDGDTVRALIEWFQRTLGFGP
jgi:dienelactone hydrolase